MEQLVILIRLEILWMNYPETYLVDSRVVKIPASLTREQFMVQLPVGRLARDIHSTYWF